MSSQAPDVPLVIDEHRSHGSIILRLSGELDVLGAEDLRARLRALQRTYRGRLVIDLAGLDFISSMGIAELVAAHAYAQRDGWVLQIRPGPPCIQRIFAICGLLEHLPFTTD